jgi:hypothetical protein
MQASINAPRFYHQSICSNRRNKMVVHSNNTVPLQQVLPFSCARKRNILICDSIECKGDFVCKTMLGEIWNEGSGRVLWLAGDATATQASLTSSLKRMGCDVLRGQVRQPTEQSKQRWMLRNLVAEMAEEVLEMEDGDVFDSEKYLKKVYRETKDWITEGSVTNGQDKNLTSSDSWIVLDDVSGMASIFGNKTVYQFVDTLLASSREQNIGLIIRCSSDIEQMIYKQQDNEANQQYTGWMGAGGIAHQHALQNALITTIPCLERSLPSKVDAIVDVLPLSSGFSRDAHGRLVFSETPNGRGWGKSGSAAAVPATSSKTVSSNNSTTAISWNNLIVNYCVHDTGVRAMRLRTAANA